MYVNTVSMHSLTEAEKNNRKLSKTQCTNCIHTFSNSI